jgi:hypothetical protein
LRGNTSYTSGSKKRARRLSANQARHQGERESREPEASVSLNGLGELLDDTFCCKLKAQRRKLQFIMGKKFLLLGLQGKKNKKNKKNIMYT